jgi:hypothetical protein
MKNGKANPDPASTKCDDISHDSHDEAATQNREAKERGKTRKQDLEERDERKNEHGAMRTARIQ